MQVEIALPFNEGRAIFFFDICAKFSNQKRRVDYREGIRVMLLQKRTQFEGRRWVYEPERPDVHQDPLFERDWEIFVVKRDPETGTFVTETVAAVENDEKD